jgi:hypothetical protein
MFATERINEDDGERRCKVTVIRTRHESFHRRRHQRESNSIE